MDWEARVRRVLADRDDRHVAALADRERSKLTRERELEASKARNEAIASSLVPPLEVLGELWFGSAMVQESRGWWRSTLVRRRPFEVCVDNGFTLKVVLKYDESVAHHLGIARPYWGKRSWQNRTDDGRGISYRYGLEVGANYGADESPRFFVVHHDYYWNRSLTNYEGTTQGLSQAFDDAVANGPDAIEQYISMWLSSE